MSLWVVDGFAVLDLHLTEPQHGAWSATLRIDSTELLADQVTIECGSGERFEGTVKTQTALDGSIHALIVGGAGKLHARLSARFYQNTSTNIVFSDIMRDGGERADSMADSKSLSSWTRKSGSTAAALNTLCSTLGLSWKIARTGKVFLSPSDTFYWPAATTTGTLLGESGDIGHREYSMLAPDIQPGTRLDGLAVLSVTYHSTAEGMTASVLLTD